jgi:predicted unusual protein kinase regulating ubiquinone biosynthesis (AarF/ABC1/UbiB family)
MFRAVRTIDVAKYAWRTSRNVDTIRRGSPDARKIAADTIAKDTSSAGVLFVKMAQFVSARGDILDDVTAAALERLQNDVPGDDEPPPDMFGYDIGKKPIASASIANVYKGVRKADGAVVAIKRTKRGAKEQVDQDLPILIDVLKFAKMLGVAGAANMLEIVVECEPVLTAEFDLRNEAKSAALFKKKFADVDWLRIPKVYEAGANYTISEFVESNKITSARPTVFLAKRLFELYLRMIVNVGLVHADPHAGNIGVLSDGTFVLYDFGAVIDVGDARPHIADLVKSAALEDIDGVFRALANMGVIKDGPTTRLRRVIPKIKRLIESDDFNRDLAKLPEFSGNDNRMFELTTKYVYLFRSLGIVQGILAYHDPKFDLKQYVDEYDDVIESADFPVWDLARGLASDVLSAPTSLKSMQTTMLDMKDTISDDFAAVKKTAAYTVFAMLLMDVVALILK